MLKSQGESLEGSNPLHSAKDLYKICSKCKIEKPEDEFYFRGHGERRADCKSCYNLMKKSKWAEGAYKDSYNVYSKKRWNRLKWENQHKLLDYFKDHPCVDCGESDPLTLEFDHPEGRGDKGYTVSVLLGRSWTMAKKEIDKCEVRCGSCHNKKTHERANTVRYKLVNRKPVVE